MDAKQELVRPGRGADDYPLQTIATRTAGAIKWAIRILAAYELLRKNKSSA